MPTFIILKSVTSIIRFQSETGYSMRGNFDFMLIFLGLKAEPALFCVPGCSVHWYWLHGEQKDLHLWHG